MDKLKFENPKDWLKDLTKRTKTDSDDEEFLRYLFVKMKIPFKIVCGLVYLDNKGNMVSIQKFAKDLLKVLESKGIITN